MLVVAFFSWWYGSGWAQVAASLGRRLRGVTNAFSTGQLFKTLFAPWRRIITYPGASLPEKFGAWGDNLFSRTVGFVVRLLVLFIAELTLIIIGVLTVIEIAVWPLLPIAIPASIVVGVL
jgi:hypothetical protein